MIKRMLLALVVSALTMATVNAVAQDKPLPRSEQAKRVRCTYIIPAKKRQCLNPALEGKTKCAVHVDEKPRCKGITDKGLQCKNYPQAGSNKCSRHEWQ